MLISLFQKNISPQAKKNVFLGEHGPTPPQDLEGGPQAPVNFAVPKKVSPPHETLITYMHLQITMLS